MPAAVTLVDRDPPGTGDTITYADRGFQPASLWTFAQQGSAMDTFADGAIIGVGWAAQDLHEGYCGYRNDDNIGIPGGKDEIRNDICWGASAAAVVDAASIVSYQAGGEQADWGGANTPGHDLFSTAFGGEGFESAAGTFSLPTAGSVTVSGLPFAPTFVAVMHNLRATINGGDASSGHWCLGFSDGTNHRAVCVSAPLALNADVKSWLRDDSITFWRNAVAPDWRSGITFTSDGFTLTPTVYPASSIIHTYFACAGVGTVVVGHDTQRTSTGVKSTATGNDPTLLLVLGGQTTAVNTQTAGGNVVAGVLCENGAQAAAWCGAQDGVGTSNTKRRQNMTSCVLHCDAAGAGTLLAEATGTLVAGGFDLDWTTADATARQFAYAALEVPIALLAGGGGSHKWWFWRGY